MIHLQKLSKKQRNEYDEKYEVAEQFFNKLSISEKLELRYKQAQMAIDADNIEWAIIRLNDALRLSPGDEKSMIILQKIRTEAKSDTVYGEVNSNSQLFYQFTPPGESEYEGSLWLRKDTTLFTGIWARRNIRNYNGNGYQMDFQTYINGSLTSTNSEFYCRPLTGDFNQRLKDEDHSLCKRIITQNDSSYVRS